MRGRGLAVASLPPATQARDLSTRRCAAAFDVDESLSMLLDSRLLPRVVGLAPDGRVPPAVAAALTSDGVIRGSCEPPLRGAPGVPQCAAERARVHRAIFAGVRAARRLGAGVRLLPELRRARAMEPSQTLRFERAYQVVKHGDEWTAVREGRVPKELRTEPRG